MRARWSTASLGHNDTPKQVDLGAMAGGSRLLLPSLPAWICVVLFGVVCTAGQIFLQHTRSPF
jgi:hypothetical protein